MNEFQLFLVVFCSIAFVVISWWQWMRTPSKGTKALATYRRARDFSALTWQDFEHLLSAVFEKDGFKVVVNGTSGTNRNALGGRRRGGGDGGVDLVMRRAGTLHIVSAKHWKGRVGVKEVRDLFATVIHHKADRGWLVAVGGFTAEAWDFVKGKPINLVNGSRLTEMLEKTEGGG